MTIVLFFSCLIGASATVATLWTISWSFAFLCAPLGGSSLVLLTAVAVAARPGLAIGDAAVPRLSLRVPNTCCAPRGRLDDKLPGVNGRSRWTLPPNGTLLG